MSQHIEARIDPTTGKTFYIDHINKTTSWEPPTTTTPTPTNIPQQQHSTTQPHKNTTPPQRPSLPSSTNHGTVDSDAALARELAAQWEAEESEAAARSAAPSTEAPPPPANSSLFRGAVQPFAKQPQPREWTPDDAATHCFLTDVKFTMVQRKHHCRYCGQVFSNEASKKTAKIPGKSSEPVRVCDICHGQLERGDPVCMCKQVASMRSASESARAAGAKALAAWAAMDPQFKEEGVIRAVEDLRLPELIVHLLATGEGHTLTAACRLAAAMVAYPEYGEMFLYERLPAALADTLRSAGSAETKTAAVLAMANITALGARDNAAGRSQLRSAGGVPALLEVLLSPASTELHEATCQVLANLCEDASNDWRQLLEAGAVFSVAGMLSSSSAALQEAALTLLAMLSAQRDCRTQFADSGALGAVSILLSSPRRDVQRAALALTHQLCTAPGGERPTELLLEAGAGSPLAAMLLAGGADADHTEVLAAALECLERFASAGLTQSQRAVRNAGAVPHLIQLMTHADPRVAARASRLVSTVCPGDVSNSEQLYESGGLVMLAEGLVSGDDRARVQVVSALSQLSADPVQAAAIVDAGCVSPLLELLEHPNQELQAYAAISFGNLTSSGALSPEALTQPALLPHVVSMLGSSNALARGPAAAAVASMVAQPHLRVAIHRHGGVTPLVALLVAEAEVAHHAVQAVAQFAADERFRALLVDAGAMTPLVALLGSSHVSHVQQCALSAVANLSFVPAAVQPLIDAGALTHIGQLLFSPEAGVVQMCLTTLCNLLDGSAATAEALLEVGGHMALLTHLSSPSDEAQSQAAMALGHMCRHAPAAEPLLAADAAPLLGQLLHAASPAVQLQAVYALGGLAATSDEGAAAVQRCGAVAPLVTLLLANPAPDAKAHIALTLAHAVRGDWKLVFNVGGFQALLDVLAVGTAAVQQGVSAAFAALLEDVHQRQALLADLNSISAVVGLLSSSDEVTVRHASAALAALAAEPSAREVLYKLGTLSHIIRSLSAAQVGAAAPGGGGGTPAAAAAAAASGRIFLVRVLAAFAADERYRHMLRITITPLAALVAGNGTAEEIAPAAAALESLSQSQSNLDALRDAGVTRKMAELLLHDDEDVRHCAACCIANLGVGASDAASFLDAGWHLSLVSQLSDPSPTVAAAAAAVLGSLASAAAFGAALLDGGAVAPIVQLLSVAALPARAAAARALATMAAQLMGADGNADAAAVLVQSILDAEGGAAPLLAPLKAWDATTTEATGADAAAAANQLAAETLRLLRHLSASETARLRLVQAGSVEALAEFLAAAAAANGGAAQSAEVLGAAASSLADQMLDADGYARLADAGGLPALLTLLRSGVPAVSSAAARAIGFVARDSAVVDAAVPVLVAALTKPRAPVAEVSFALTNMYALRREAFGVKTVEALAIGLARALSDGAEGAEHVLGLVHQLALRPDHRAMLCAAGLPGLLRAGGCGDSLLASLLSSAALKVPGEGRLIEEDPPVATEASEEGVEGASALPSSLPPPYSPMIQLE